MNIYVVAEGLAEREVYLRWIPLVNPSLCPVDHIEDVNNDNFYLISGRGYPHYFEAIEDAIADVNGVDKFDRLVVSVDSHEMSHAEKVEEMELFFSTRVCHVEIRVVIQHFCFETWALGNRTIIRQHPESARLVGYRALFDVRSQDPELLPSNSDEDLNRSQFAAVYLKAALNDKYRNLTYTKSNPRPLYHQSYFERVRNRFDNTDHIASFDGFLSAFV